MRKKIDVRLELRLQEYEQPKQESDVSGYYRFPVPAGTTAYTGFMQRAPGRNSKQIVH